jgi:hypothetical protein
MTDREGFPTPIAAKLTGVGARHAHRDRLNRRIAITQFA